MNASTPCFPTRPSDLDHSTYDSFSWVDTYGDPGFRYFQTMSKVWGLAALRLSSSHVLPFDPPLQADALEGYLAALYPSPSAEDVEKGGDGAVAAGAVAAKSAVSLSDIDLAPLEDAVAEFRAAADKIGSWAGRRDSDGDGDGDGGGGGGDGSGGGGGGVAGGGGGYGGISTTAAAAARAVALRGAGAGLAGESQNLRGEGDSGSGGAGEREGALPTGGGLSTAADRLQKESLNQRLAMTERRFLTAEGLPGRQWFRHVLQAPGLYLG